MDSDRVFFNSASYRRLEWNWLFSRVLPDKPHAALVLEVGFFGDDFTWNVPRCVYAPINQPGLSYASSFVVLPALRSRVKSWHANVSPID